MALFQNIKVECPKCQSAFWAEVYQKTKSVKCRSCAKAIPRRKSWRGSWGCVYLIHGRKLKETVGTKTQAAQREALRKKQDRGLEPGGNPRIRVYQVAADYLEWSQMNLKPKTHRRYVTSSKAVLPVFGAREVRQVTPLDVEAFKKVRLERDQCRPATVNRDVAFLRGMLRKGVEWGLIPKNPVAGVAMLKEHNERERFLDVAEVEALISSGPSPDLCAKNPNYMVPVIIALADTGMRPGEPATLRWSDLDFSRRVIRLSDTENIKYSKKREIPMTERVYKMFRKLTRNLKYPDVVFLGPHLKPLKSFQHGFAAVVERAGLEDVIPHDLRSSFIMRGVLAGVDIYTMAKWVGHTDIKEMMRKYGRFTQDNSQAAIRKLETYTAQKFPKTSRQARGRKKGRT